VSTAAGLDMLTIGQARTAMIGAVARGLHEAGITYTLPASASATQKAQELAGQPRVVEAQSSVPGGVPPGEVGHAQMQQRQDEAMFAAAAALTTLNSETQHL
jgi:hypothetical protein